jgi:hypothetical protein
VLEATAGRRCCRVLDALGPPRLITGVRMLMKRRLFITYLSFIIGACSLNAVFGKDPPASAEQLRSELESTFENKDANAIMSLICWDGMDSELKIMASGMMAAEVARSGTNIIHFTLLPVPTNFQATVTSFLPDWEGDDGRRGKYNVPVIGMIHMDYGGRERANRSVDLPYGKKGDAFYIAQLISFQVPGKALEVRVDNLPTFLTYTGYWVYVQAGKEITVIINDHTNHFRKGWGDYVKHCTVRRTSLKETPGVGNYFEYRITEDRTNVVFESGQMTNDEPVTYERK